MFGCFEFNDYNDPFKKLVFFGDNSEKIQIFEKGKIEKPIFEYINRCIGADIIGKRYIVVGGDGNNSLI